MYCPRDFVCEKIQISRWQSYTLFEPTDSGLINLDKVIAFLNRARRNDEALTFLPSDIVTMDEAEKSLELPGATIKKWLKKKCPHFKINSHTIRVRLSSIKKWLDKHS